MAFNFEAAMRLIDEAVLKVIQEHCGPDGISRVSVEDIARATRSSPATVKRATARLDGRLIKKQGQKRNLIYRMVNTDADA